MASAFPFFPHVWQGSSQPSQIPAAHAPAEPKRGLLARVLDALIESRQREAEERLARLLVPRSTFTDSTQEREAERSGSQALTHSPHPGTRSAGGHRATCAGRGDFHERHHVPPSGPVRLVPLVSRRGRFAAGTPAEAQGLEQAQA